MYYVKNFSDHNLYTLLLILFYCSTNHLQIFLFCDNVAKKTSILFSLHKIENFLFFEISYSSNKFTYKSRTLAFSLKKLFCKWIKKKPFQINFYWKQGNRGFFIDFYFLSYLLAWSELASEYLYTHPLCICPPFVNVLYNTLPWRTQIEVDYEREKKSLFYLELVWTQYVYI